MRVLVEFYDRSILKNYVTALAIKPDVIKFFYDPNVFKAHDIYSTYAAAKKYIPNLNYEVGKIHEHDYHDVEDALVSYIKEREGDEIYIDITGGNELATIAGYETGKSNDCHVYFTDITQNRVVNLRTKDTQYRSMPFEIGDTIEAFGGKLVGYTDPEFLEEFKTPLYNAASYILNHLNQWLRTCQYFQKYNSPLRQSGSLNFNGPIEGSKNGNKKIPDMDTLYFLSKQRLIDGLVENTKGISFRYKNQKIMDYMSSYGVWLELYTYYHVKDIVELHDVHTSLKVDWNAHDQIEIVGNEIDVTAMYNCRPVLISCKQSTSPISADALNELYVVSRRIGGKYAIPMMVTCSPMKTQHLGLYLKAREMGILLLDISDVLSESFGKKLERLIVGEK